MDLIKNDCYRKPLQDDAYHKIFEAIFRIVRSDKSIYLSTDAATRKKTTVTRLEASADTLRLAVEVGTPTISTKTAAALIDHMTDILPVGEGEYLAPLRGPYLKSIRAILGHQSHVEHLRRKQWQSLADFLIAGINHDTSDDTPSTLTTSRLMNTEEFRNSPRLSVRTSQFSSVRSQRAESKSSSPELVLCLNLLTAATNAPLITRADAILDCLTGFLEHATISQPDALTAFNNVLSVTITENLRLSRSAVFCLLPILRRLWSTKSTSVKDQMMVTLILGKEVFAARDSARDLEADSLSLHNLFDAIVLEYQRRNDRDVLHIDDIRFAKFDDSQPVGLDGIVPIVESGRALANWTVVSLLACLAAAVDSFPAATGATQFPDEMPKKRRKLTKQADDLIDSVLMESGVERARGLQILVFLLDESEGFSDKLADHFIQVATCISDDDPACASWAMLLIAQ